MTQVKHWEWNFYASLPQVRLLWFRLDCSFCSLVTNFKRKNTCCIDDDYFTFGVELELMKDFKKFCSFWLIRPNQKCVKLGCCLLHWISTSVVKLYQGGSARRIACNLMNLNQVYENHKIRISLTVLSQLVLKYAYALDILIHQFVHMEFSDGTLPILLNFWKTIWLQKTWMKLNQVHWKNCFSNV